MRTIEECKELTKPQLLAEIKNRYTLKAALPSTPGIQEELDKLWKMLERK